MMVITLILLACLNIKIYPDYKGKQVNQNDQKVGGCTSTSSM